MAYSATVPVVLFGGPRDGQPGLVLSRQPGVLLPDELPDIPGYRLAGADKHGDPPAIHFHYRWEHPRTGQRHRCQAFDGRCTSAGCPSRKAQR